MRLLISFGLGLWITLSGAAQAQTTPNGPVVVELYTSQGCSSCPPADKLLAGLADRPDVIPLALHVDYWDYIGWKDKFADPAFSDRQRAYAREAGAQTIYTPQMIIAGMEHLVGVRPAEVESVIGREAARPAAVTLALRRHGGTVEVTAEAAAALPKGAVVQMVRYAPGERVEIAHGENAGKVIDYVNIVTEWKAVADWDGRAPLSLELRAPGPKPVVVIVQEPGPGAILAAAVLR